MLVSFNIVLLTFIEAIHDIHSLSLLNFPRVLLRYRRMLNDTRRMCQRPVP